MVGICEAHLKFRELTGNQVLPHYSHMHISRIFYFWLIPLSDRHQNQLLSTVQTATIWTGSGILNLLFARPLSFLIGSSIASSYQCIDHHLASVSSPSHLCSSCSWGLFLKSRHFRTSWDLQLCLHVPAVLDQLPSSHPAPPLFLLFPRLALFHHCYELLASASSGVSFTSWQLTSNFTSLLTRYFSGSSFQHTASPLLFTAGGGYIQVHLTFFKIVEDI